MRRFYILLFLSVVFGDLVAQHKKIDSLQKVFSSAEEDSVKFTCLLRIGNIYQKISIDSANEYHTRARNTAREMKDRIREGHAILQLGTNAYFEGRSSEASRLYNVAAATGRQYILSGKTEQLREAKKLYAGALTAIAIFSKDHGDYHGAMVNHLKALKLFDEVGFANGHMGALGNIGNIYNDIGNYPLALEYNFKALKIAEESNNSKGKAINLINIGTVYNFMGDHDKALEYFSKALKIYEKKKNKRDMAGLLGDMAQVYNSKREYARALKLAESALKLCEESGVAAAEAAVLSQLGLIYNSRGDSAAERGNVAVARLLYPRALEYYEKARALHERSGNRAFLATTLGNMGDLYASLQEYPKAESLLKQAYAISSSIKATEIMKDHALFLSRLYEKTGRVGEAFDFYKRYTEFRDSVNSNDVTRKTTRLEMKYVFEKKVTADSTRAAEEQKAANLRLEASEAKLAKEKMMKTFLYAGLALVIVFALFIFNRFKVTMKQKDIIEKQKEVVESKNLIIEQKQKEILDSIKYAQRIQRAHLPSEKKVTGAFLRLKK